MSVILLNPRFPPSHNNKVSVTLICLFGCLPLALAEHWCQGLVTSIPSSTVGIQVSWLLATEWEVLKTYWLSANTVSAWFPTCYNDALHFSLFVKMSLNL